MALTLLRHTVWGWRPRPTFSLAARRPRSGIPSLSCGAAASRRRAAFWAILHRVRRRHRRGRTRMSGWLIRQHRVGLTTAPCQRSRFPRFYSRTPVRPPHRKQSRRCRRLVVPELLPLVKELAARSLAFLLVVGRTSGARAGCVGAGHDNRRPPCPLLSHGSWCSCSLQASVQASRGLYARAYSWRCVWHLPPR